MKSLFTYNISTIKTETIVLVNVNFSFRDALHRVVEGSSECSGGTQGVTQAQYFLLNSLVRLSVH